MRYAMQLWPILNSLWFSPPAEEWRCAVVAQPDWRCSANEGDNFGKTMYTGTPHVKKAGLGLPQILARDPVLQQ